MGLGSCWVLRFDPMLILIKNIICIFYFIAFVYESKSSKAQNIKQNVITEKKRDNSIQIELKEIELGGENLLTAVNEVNNLDKPHLKILFWIKIFLQVLVIYIIEELYFLLSNCHVFDRVIFPIINFGILFL